MGSLKKARKIKPENAPEEPERKRKTKKTKTKYGLSFYIGIIFAVLGSIVLAWWWCFKVSAGKMGIGDVIASFVGLATVVGIFLGKDKLHMRWKGILAYMALIAAGVFCTALLVFGTVGSLLRLRAAEEAAVPESQTKTAFADENERTFQQMTFNYEDDVLIENLEYYIDGQMISQNDRKNVLCAFFQEHIGDGLPKKYETNETKLNSGAYAKYTNQANAYFQSYEAVKDIDIETGDKLLLILKARTYRGKANEEYITEENSWNFIWDCLAANEVLSTCIVDSTDEDEIKEYQALMKECNRDIMCAAWNILRIRYHFDHTVDAGAKEKLKEAYKWERDHAPESGVDYDMLIWAVENLNG